MYFYQPTSLTGRASKSTSPDFLLLLEVKSLLFQAKDYHYYLQNGISKELVIMAQGIPLRLPVFFVHTQEMGSANSHLPTSCGSPIFFFFFGEWSFYCSLPIMLVWTLLECIHMWLVCLGLTLSVGSSLSSEGGDHLSFSPEEGPHTRHQNTG